MAATNKVAGNARKTSATVETRRALKSRVRLFSRMVAMHTTQKASESSPSVMPAAPPLANNHTALPRASIVPADAPRKMMTRAPVWMMANQIRARTADEVDATARVVIVSALAVAKEMAGLLGDAGADGGLDKAATRVPFTIAIARTPTRCKTKSRANVTSRYASARGHRDGCSGGSTERGQDARPLSVA